MTAYDAFAIAFDEIADEEVVAMDKKPQTMIHQKRNKKFGASGSDALPSAGGSLPKNGDSSQSLAQHMQQYHPDGFDPHKNKCKFFDALQKNFEQQGLSKEEAEKKALEAHNRSGYGGATGEAVAEEKGRQLADQLFQQLKAKPSAFAIEGLARQARLIQPPMEIEGGEDGEKIQIQDTFQLACMMFLQDQKESGNEVVENAAEKAENRIVETLGGEGDKTEQTTEQSQLGGYEQILKEHPERKELYDKMNELLAKQKEIAAREATTEEESNKNQEEYNNINAELASVGAKLREGYERQFEGYEEGDSRKVETEGQTVEPVSQKLTSTDGAYSRDLTVAETATLQAYPERKEQLQLIVDLEAKLQGANEQEQADLQNQIEALKIIFNGKEEAETSAEGGETPTESPPETEGETEGTEPTSETGETAGAGESGETAETGTETTEKKAEEKPSEENPEAPQPESETEEPTEEPEAPEQEPTPADEEFMTKNGKYKLGNVTYTDVSQHGLLGGMVAAFLAGMRGEGIITGWDRISGTWDQMKRSANGENVRDGIKGALTNLGLDAYMEKVQDPVARGKLETIKEMFQKAKTPMQKMAAYNAFEKWKEKYGGGSEISGNSSVNANVASSMESVHADGKVLGGSQRIDNKGNIVDDSETNKMEQPTTDILGEPGFLKSDGSISWSPEAKIENLDQKKETIESAMGKIKNPILGKEAGHTTSHNSTFVRYDLMDRITKQQKEELVKQLAFDLGCEENEVSVAVDSKNKQLVVGIKNDVAADLATRDIMNSDEWKKACKTMRCPVILGRDNQGNAVIRDLKDLTHLLIAGDTGKGKSVGMNTILCSMMMAKKPSQLKTVLIDLKKVELSRYKNSKFNAVPVATDIDSALKSLEFVRQEMENRENLLEQAGVANIDEYNAKARAEGKNELPTMVLGIDELTELKEAGGKQVYDLLKTIGNKARASGIHLLCATQKPTKENIGEVKSAFTSRLAFPIKAPEGSEAIFKKGDYRANSLTGNGSFILDVDGKETRGKGSAMGHDDPQRVVGYWNGEPPKTDEEQLKALEEELSGIHPEMTDSAQAKEAEERKASDIQRKINQLKEKMAKASGGGKTLPQEHQEQIQAAIENGQPISMEAEEGFMDAFKGSFPEGWSITEETVDGETHWKASPPKKEEAKPIESGTATESAESSKPTTLDFSSPQALADSIEKIQKEEIAKAKEIFANSERSESDEAKLAKAIHKANERADKRRIDFASELKGASIEEGDETLSEEAATVKEETAEPEESDEDSPASLMKDAKAQLEAEKQRIDKKLANPSLKLRERRKLRQEKDALQKRFNEAKAKFEAGGSTDEILDILEPEEKPEGSKEGPETTNSGNPTAEEESPQLTEEEQKAAAEQEQAKKNEQLRKTVKPQEAYGESTLWGKREATERLTPKEIKTISEKFMPPGWEFVTENGFNAPARDRFGLIFVRDPATGSHGRLIPSKGNPGTYKLQKDVDTTHPEYKGMVQKEDGSWGLSPEAAKVEAETRADRKQTKDPKKRKEALTRYHRAVFGHDEAPDNMTIVANAVAKALAKIN